MIRVRTSWTATTTSEETASRSPRTAGCSTGDKGALDADGYLRITGRLKELFKTSGGKYIAPPAIEAKFKALCPYVSQFLVFGDGATTSSPSSRSTRTRSGWGAENGLAATTPRSSARTPAGDSQGYVASSTGGSTAGRPSRSGSSWTTTSPSSPASSPPR